MAKMQKITPNLWFDKNAEEAVKYYTSIFKNSKIVRTSYYGKEGFEQHKMQEGSVMTIEFELEGQKFVALNGGPLFRFTEAISFVVHCDTQEEIDYYWNNLIQGGDKNYQQCGWLRDKFGLSWQITPTVLPDMLTDYDQQKSQRAMKAMMQMKKLDIEKLEEAFEGKSAVTH